MKVGILIGILPTAPWFGDIREKNKIGFLLRRRLKQAARCAAYCLYNRLLITKRSVIGLPTIKQVSARKNPLI